MFGDLNLLWYESSTFTFLASFCVLWEEQLWTMEDIHQHWELSLDQWPQTVLQRWHYILHSIITHNQGLVSGNCRFTTKVHKLRLKVSPRNIWWNHGYGYLLLLNCLFKMWINQPNYHHNGHIIWSPLTDWLWHNSFNEAFINDWRHIIYV